MKVNVSEIRKKIIEMLRNESGSLSGEKMAAELGFSRVALWKHIKFLKNSGYGISSDPSGYRIDKSEDFLYPWEFGKYENQIIHFGEIDSTMNQALKYEYSAGTILLAEKQSCGKGTGGRSWSSEPGGLFFTHVIRGGNSAHRYLVSTLRSLVVIRNALLKCGIDCTIKWPNDLLYNEKKVAGVLTEAIISGDRCYRINSGIGININNAVDAQTQASLSQILNKQVSRKEIFSRYLEEYEVQNTLSIDPVAEISSELRKRPQMISWRLDKKEYTGFIRALTPEGAAIVTSGASSTVLYPGDRDI